MNEPLRPSSLGEILDRTAQLYRSRFLVFLGISVLPVAVVVVLICLVGLVATWWGTAGAHSVSSGAGYILVVFFFVGGLLVALPILLAVTALASAAMSHAVSRIHLGGTTTIRGAYKSVWPHGWRYIWLYLMQGLLVWAAPISVWFVLVGVSAVAASSIQKLGVSFDAFFGLAVVLVVVALLGYFIWMLLRFSLAFPACVVEQIGAWRAVKRSFALSLGTKGRICLLYLLGAALGWISSIVVMFPLIILFSLIPGINNPQHAKVAGVVMVLVVYGSAFAVQSLIKPVYGIALVLFYYDQRIRKEGYDIELLMQQAGMVTEAGPAPTAPEPAPWLPPVPRIAPIVAAQPVQAAAPPQSAQPQSEATGEPQ